MMLLLSSVLVTVDLHLWVINIEGGGGAAWWVRGGNGDQKVMGSNPSTTTLPHRIGVETLQLRNITAVISGRSQVSSWSFHASRRLVYLTCFSTTPSLGHTQSLISNAKDPGLREHPVSQHFESEV